MSDTSVFGFQLLSVSGSSPVLTFGLGLPGRGAAIDVGRGSHARFKTNRPAIIAKNKNNVFAKTIEGPVGKSY